MIKFVFCVFDSKARVFSNPFYAVREEVAIRDFTRAVNDPSMDMYRFPSDFALFRLGTFDDEAGLFDVVLSPVPVVTALQVKE